MSDRGSDRERKVRQWYQDRGWLAFRAPASLGVADVVAMRAGTDPFTLQPQSRWAHVALCEVKSTVAGPYHSFGPEARQRLSAAARQAGAVAVLAWWPPRGELKFLYESDWPKGKETK